MSSTALRFQPGNNTKPILRYQIPLRTAMSNEGDPTTLATRRLDLTARALDLCTVLSQSSSISGGLYELGQWLALERVDRSELYDCFTRAKGLVYANARGQIFYSDISKRPPESNTWPLKVQQSGSLGRLIIKDPHLSWIASTIACLFRFHNHQFVSDAICLLILLSDPENEGRPDYEVNYLASRIELKAVIDKIVSSVWFNIINVGNNTENLPAELQAVCESGHNLSSDKFAVVTHALLRARERVVVESDHLLKNLTLWLLLHFQGALTVVVSGKVLFDRVLGGSTQTIELRVRTFCIKDTGCCMDAATYRLLSDIRGSFEEFLSGKCPSSVDMPEAASTRKQLYNVVHAYDINIGILSEEAKAKARQTAQSMVEWLLQLRLTAPAYSVFEFSIPCLDIDEENRGLTVGNILGRSPSILNLKLGRGKAKSVVYAEPDEIQLSTSVKFGEEDILRLFPVLQDLVLLAKADCMCVECRRKALNPDKTSLPRGCKGHSAVSFVLLIVSHAIADGFGAPDVSGSRDADPILKATVAVFSEMLNRQQIRWDTWFNTAASVYLGCPFRESVLDIQKGRISFAAIQYGNMAVVAPWLDITREQGIANSFRFNRAYGTLGVQKQFGERYHFRGITEKFAIVQAEHAEDTSSFNRRFSKWPEPSKGVIAVSDDDSTFTTEVMLVHGSEELYRLLLRVRSDTFVRIVDPVDVMIFLSNSVPEVQCGHETKLLEVAAPQDRIKLYTFDELLGRWQNEKSSRDSRNAESEGCQRSGQQDEDEHTSSTTFHVTSILKDQGKINVAKALASRDTVLINKGQCCLACSIQRAKTLAVSEDEAFDLTEVSILNIMEETRLAIRDLK